MHAIKSHKKNPPHINFYCCLVLPMTGNIIPNPMLTASTGDYLSYDNCPVGTNFHKMFLTYSIYHMKIQLHILRIHHRKLEITNITSLFYTLPFVGLVIFLLQFMIFFSTNSSMCYILNFFKQNKNLSQVFLSFNQYNAIITHWY